MCQYHHFHCQCHYQFGKKKTNQVVMVSHEVVLHSCWSFQLFSTVWTRKRILDKEQKQNQLQKKKICYIYMIFSQTLLYGCTSLQVSRCFFNPSTVFLPTLLHFGQLTLPFAKIWSCHFSSWLPVKNHKIYSILWILQKYVYAVFI